MIRLTVAVALVLALSACSNLLDYRVGVNDPTRRDTVQEPTYYDRNKRDTIHPQSGSNR